jgi:hypothetical protein
VTPTSSAIGRALATPWTPSATISATVRTIEFGPLERRTIGHDFRRTGAVEAIAGGAKAEAVAHAMGNTLSASNALFATYVPVNVTTLRDVMAARRAGRRKLR